MSNAVTTGAFTLGGVVVGGTITGTMTYVLTRRGERRLARAAARLVLEDAFQTGRALNRVLDDGKWYPMDDVTLDQWHKHRDTFASELRPEDWRCVDEAYVDLQLLVNWYAATPLSPDLEAEDREMLTHARDKLEHAIRDHLIQLSNHGPQRRRMAIRYHHVRHKLRRGEQNTNL
jgi:hypothetical protein